MITAIGRWKLIFFGILNTAACTSLPEVAQPDDLTQQHDPSAAARSEPFFMMNGVALDLEVTDALIKVADR